MDLNSLLENCTPEERKEYDRIFERYAKHLQRSKERQRQTYEILRPKFYTFKERNVAAFLYEPWENDHRMIDGIDYVKEWAYRYYDVVLAAIDPVLMDLASEALSIKSCEPVKHPYREIGGKLWPWSTYIDSKGNHYSPRTVCGRVISDTLKREKLTKPES